MSATECAKIKNIMSKEEILFFLNSNKDKQITNSPAPFMNWLAPVLINFSEGSLELAYTVRAEMANPVGILHGGVIAAIIDDSIGATLITYGKLEFHATINLTIDYLGAAKPGDTIIALTKVIKKGKQLTNAICEIWNKDKTRMLAKGSSNLLLANQYAIQS